MMTHPALKYVKDVLNDKIPACKWVKLACERHLRDLKDLPKKGFYFDIEAAQRAIDFFQFLKHSKGEWAGQTFEPAPWEQFIDYSIFGWKRADGYRRFRTVYIEVARKNGKSTYMAKTGLYLFFADGEPGAEIYTAATKRDQAIITHSEATRMVKKSPELKSMITIYKNNLSVEETASKFEPLGRDSDSCDGLNIHGSIVDELHAHKTRDMWDILETATGARRQPLQFAITTAGYDKTSVCWEQHEYVEQILKGVVQDETYFGIIYTIDLKKDWPELITKEESEKGLPGTVEDDWTDEKIWIKANPNIDVSVKRDDLKRKCKRAQKIPSAQNNFLRKHLDVWTQQSSRWLNLDTWDLNYARQIQEEKLKGRLCFGGLDLSSVSDITAWVMIFPDEEDSESIDVLARLWCPETKLYDDTNRFKNQYQAWKGAGWLITTPGNAIDYQFVKAQILKDAEKFRLDSMNIDRLFQGYQIMMELEDERLNITPMGMGYLSFATPMKEFEGRVLKKKINHGNNPVLRWMIDNLAVSEDPAGNLKPNKAESQGKIDGIVALIMALDRAMRGSKKKSRYEDGGLTII